MLKANLAKLREEVGQNKLEVRFSSEAQANLQELLDASAVEQD